MQTFFRSFRRLAAFLPVTLSFASYTARAEVLFEGFYRVERNGDHVGYVIQQHSRDEKKRSQTLRYYTVIKDKTGQVQRMGVEARVDGQWNPLGVTTWTRMGALSSTAKASFKKSKVKVDYMDASQKKVLRGETLDLPAGGTLSGFVLNALQSKTPKWTGVTRYTAFVEETQRFAEGAVTVKSDTIFGDKKVRHVQDSLLNEEIDFVVFENGEVMASRSEDKTRLVYLVKDQKAATGEVPFLKEEVLKHFGGRIPDGKTNPLANADIEGLKSWVEALTPVAPRGTAGSVSTDSAKSNVFKAGVQR